MLDPEYAAGAHVFAGVKVPDLFWTETATRLTDLSLGALLYALHRAPDGTPPGIVRANTAAWEDTRYAWAAGLISDEIAAAPGLSIDSATGLALVWEVALAELPRGPKGATFWARWLLASQASWARELANRMRGQMQGSTLATFEAELLKGKWGKLRATPMRPRPRADPFEHELVAAKELEHRLRAEFDDIDDLGATPRAADRRAFVQALAAGFDAEQIMDALRGRADKARRSRRWKDIDTAQVFLRLVWVCGSTRRLVEAEQVGASLRTDQGGIIVGEGGRRFVHGREIVE